MSPERVDKEGVGNVAQAASKALQRRAQRVETSQVLSMSSQKELSKWKVLSMPPARRTTLEFSFDQVLEAAN